MRRALFILTVGVTVSALWPVGAKGVEVDQEIRQLRAENNLLKATLAQRDKKIEVMNKEIETLKAEPAQVEAEKLRKELADAKAQVEKLSKELERIKPSTQPQRVQDEKPPVTLKAVAGMNALQRSQLVGVRIFGNVIVASIEPVAGGTYRIVGIDMSGDQGVLMGGVFVATRESGTLASAHWIKNRWVQVRCILHAPEDTALRLRAGVKDGSELNIAGKVKQVQVDPGTKETFDVVNLELEDVRAR